VDGDRLSAPPRRPPWLEHLQEPRGAGSWPPGSPGVATGEAGDESDGRLIRLQLRSAGDGRIEGARFKAFGCAATLASASYLAERVAGLPLDAARAIRADEVARALELPEDRRRAPELAVEALRQALDRLGNAG
jgi:NifU-like protein involved in Fe-S cluster formation